MSTYLIRRALGAVIVMWAVATLVFFMLRVVPGDPIGAMLFDAGDAEAVAALRQRLGLDQPLVVQYLKWFWHMLQGDFGSSIYGSRQPVGRLIAEAAPRTLSLAGLSFVLALVIAVPAGLIAATRRNTALDHGVTLFAFLGLSMPDFWIAILLIIVFAAGLQWLPAIGYVPLADGFWPWLKHLILPSIAVGTAFSAIIARMIRSAMLEVLKTDYMRVARAKGLTNSVVLLRHAWRNSLISILTLIGFSVSNLVGGSYIIETIFSWPGMGQLGFDALLKRDYPVVLGTLYLFTLLGLFAKLMADISYVLIDPRIHFESVD